MSEDGRRYRLTMGGMGLPLLYPGVMTMHRLLLLVREDGKLVLISHRDKKSTFWRGGKKGDQKGYYRSRRTASPQSISSNAQEATVTTGNQAPIPQERTNRERGYLYSAVHQCI